MPILEKQNKNLSRILIMAEIMANSYFLAAESNGSFGRYSSHFEFISKSCYGMLRGQ